MKKSSKNFSFHTKRVQHSLMILFLWFLSNDKIAFLLLKEMFFSVVLQLCFFLLCFRNVRNVIVLSAKKNWRESTERKREHIFIYHHDTEFLE